jgi:hypothetical protein
MLEPGPRELPEDAVPGSAADVLARKPGDTARRAANVPWKLLAWTVAGLFAIYLLIAPAVAPRPTFTSSISMDKRGILHLVLKVRSYIPIYTMDFFPSTAELGLADGTTTNMTVNWGPVDIGVTSETWRYYLCASLMFPREHKHEVQLYPADYLILGEKPERLKLRIPIRINSLCSPVWWMLVSELLPDAPLLGHFDRTTKIIEPEFKLR